MSSQLFCQSSNHPNRLEVRNRACIKRGKTFGARRGTPEEMPASSISSSALINTLPTELLRPILLYACSDEPLILPPTGDAYPPDHSLSHLRPPALVISWVCRLWADIAVLDTEFWTPPILIDFFRFDLDAEGYTTDVSVQRMLQRREDLISRSLSLLQCYLTRSKSAPLRVELQALMHQEEC